MISLLIGLILEQSGCKHLTIFETLEAQKWVPNKQEGPNKRVHLTNK